MEKLLNLKENNKLLYYLLFPIIIFVIVLKFMSDNNISAARDELNDTENNDIELAKLQDDYNAEANDLVDDALDDMNGDGVGENWNAED